MTKPNENYLFTPYFSKYFSNRFNFTIPKGNLAAKSVATTNIDLATGIATGLVAATDDRHNPEFRNKQDMTALNKLLLNILLLSSIRSASNARTRNLNSPCSSLVLIQ